jgi:hypothetical protein
MVFVFLVWTLPKCQAEIWMQHIGSIIVRRIGISVALSPTASQPGIFPSWAVRQRWMLIRSVKESGRGDIDMMAWRSLTATLELKSFSILWLAGGMCIKAWLD